MPWITCLWPGLSRLWLRGQWSGLFWAVMFAVLVNLALATSLLWPETVTSSVRRFEWLAVAGVWVVSAGLSFRRLRELSSPPGRAEGEDLFSKARDEYLRGNWYEAEELLRQLLRRDPCDVESQLALAAVYRHTRRTDEARRQLRQLERLERAEPWKLEIEKERELLQRHRGTNECTSDLPTAHER